MSARILIVLTVFIIYSFIPQTSAIVCYDCDSRSNSDCLTGAPNKHTQTNCPSYVNSCVKMFGQVNGKDYVARKCNLLNQCLVADIGTTFGANAYSVNCVNCNNDLCNSSNPIKSNKLFGFVGGVLLIALSKLFY